MKLTSPFTFLAAAVLLGASHAAADPIPAPATLASRQYNTLTYEGCFSSSSGLSFNSSYEFNTKGHCQTLCVPANYAVQAITNKTDCWCGNEVPPSSSLVSDSYCNDPCAGYDTEMCGSAGGTYLSVYLTGLTNNGVSVASTSASSSSQTPSSTTTAKPSVVTIGGQTATVTASSSPATSSSSSGGGPSKAGIAAGVVVGIVAIGAIAGGIFLFIRNKRRREVEEEYRRNAAVSSFISGGKPPTSSGGASFTDTRLDPVLAQRRMSDGSIADNEDYSRRILKVTNA